MHLSFPVTGVRRASRVSREGIFGFSAALPVARFVGNLFMEIVR
jgi:hypothetical protein